MEGGGLNPKEVRYKSKGICVSHDHALTSREQSTVLRVSACLHADGPLGGMAGVHAKGW